MKSYFFSQLAKPALSLALFICFFSAAAQVSVPKLDTSFNHVGQAALTDLYTFEPLNQVIQPDGKILVTGYGRNGETEDFDGIVYRLNPNGSIDAGFGNNGLVVIDIDGTHDNVTDIAVLPDNKILLLVESNHRTIFVKLLTNGGYDLDFGNEGILLGADNINEISWCMLIQQDQKILVIGSKSVTSSKQKGIVRRFNPDGSIDTSYGNNGEVFVVIDAAKTLELNAGVLQPDGKLVVTGLYGTGSGSGFPVVRLNVDGSFDTSFSGDGMYAHIVGSAAGPGQAYCIAINNDGTIFIGGSAPYGNETMMTLMSVKPNGSLNTGFGSFGFSRAGWATYASMNQILIQPDGKILTAGYAYINQTSTGMAFARFMPNGQLDGTFGTGGQYGIHITIPWAVQIIADIDFTADGRLLALAWLNLSIYLTAPNNPASCVVFRFTTDIMTSSVEPSPVISEAKLFPNPVKDNEPVVLCYQLDKSAPVSIALFDMNGRLISSLVSEEDRYAGEQTEQFYLPGALPGGQYSIILSTPFERKALKFIKH